MTTPCRDVIVSGVDVCEPSGYRKQRLIPPFLTLKRRQKVTASAAQACDNSAYMQKQSFFEGIESAKLQSEVTKQMTERCDFRPARAERYAATETCLYITMLFGRDLTPELQHRIKLTAGNDALMQKVDINKFSAR